MAKQEIRHKLQKGSMRSLRGIRKRREGPKTLKQQKLRKSMAPSVFDTTDFTDTNSTTTALTSNSDAWKVNDIVPENKTLEESNLKIHSSRTERRVAITKHSLLNNSINRTGRLESITGKINIYYQNLN